MEDAMPMLRYKAHAQLRDWITMHVRHDIEVCLSGQCVERVLPCLLGLLGDGDVLLVPKWRKLVSKTRAFARTVQRRKGKRCKEIVGDSQSAAWTLLGSSHRISVSQIGLGYL